MHEWNSMSHVRWDCKYHIVFIPKYRKKIMYGKLRRSIYSRRSGEMALVSWQYSESKNITGFNR
jgi:REP element-mobilizing transposase RayT